MLLGLDFMNETPTSGMDHTSGTFLDKVNSF